MPEANLDDWHLPQSQCPSPCRLPEATSAQLFRRCDLKLIAHVFLSRSAYRFGFQVALLFFRLHWPPQRNFAIFHEDFDVASVGRETLIVVNRFSDFLRKGAVRGIHLLLIRGKARLIVAQVGVVWPRMLSIETARGECHHQ
jgi:hypothetical protein